MAITNSKDLLASENDRLIETATKTNNPRALSKMAVDYRDNPAVLLAISGNSRTPDRTLESVIISAIPRGGEDSEALERLELVRKTALKTLKRKLLLRKFS